MKIFIQDKELILSKDTSISLRWKFPVFWTDNLPQSYTDWFLFDATDENTEVFNWAHKRDIENNYAVYDNVVYMFEGIAQKGKLILKNATHNKYKAFIVIGVFEDGFTDKMIAELIDENIYLGTEEEILDNVKTYSTANSNNKIAFPMIWNSKFYGDKNPDFGGNLSYLIHPVVNNYDRLAEEYYPNSITADPLPDNVNSLVPYVYLKHVLKSVFSDFNLKGDFFNNTDIDKIIVYNNYALDRIEKDKYIAQAEDDVLLCDWELSTIHYFNFNSFDDEFNIFTGNEYEFKVKGYHKIQISFDTEDTYNVNESAGFDDFWIYWNYPDNKFVLNHFENREYYDSEALYKSSYALEDIFWIDSADIGNLNELVFKADCSPLIYNNMKTTIKNFVVKITPVSYNELNQFSGNISLKNHMPDISVSKLFNNICKGFGLSAFFSNSEIDFDFFEDILDNPNAIDLTDYVINNTTEITLERKEYEFVRNWGNDRRIDENFKDYSIYPELPEVENLSDLPLDNSNLGSVCRVKSLKAVYKCILNDSKKIVWERFSDDFSDVKSQSANKETINIDFSTLTMINDYPDLLMPVIEQTGSSEVYSTGKNEPGFKLLFYHGLTVDTNGYEYPFATSGRYDINGNEKSGFSLDIGNDGLYNKFISKSMNYIKRRKIVEMEFSLNAMLLHKVKQIFEPQGRKNKIRKIRVGNQNYIPLEVKINNNRNGIKSCKMKLL